MKLYIMEAVGTFFLMLAIGLGDPLTIGVTLMTLVYLGGHISGGHYNPAVTLAVFLRGAMSKALVPGYMLAQLGGAFVAGAFALYLTGAIPGPMPDTNFSLWEIALIEALLTGLLCWTVLTVATSSKFRGHSIYGIAIGFCLYAIVMMGHNITGGVFNPAVTVGATLLALINHSSIMTVSILLTYLAGQFVGAFAGAHAFKYLNSDER
jgi:aquaporin Z